MGSALRHAGDPALPLPPHFHPHGCELVWTWERRPGCAVTCAGVCPVGRALLPSPGDSEVAGPAPGLQRPGASSEAGLGRSALLGFARGFTAPDPSVGKGSLKPVISLKKKSPFLIIHLPRPSMFPLPLLGSAYTANKAPRGGFGHSYEDFRCDELCTDLSLSAGVWLFSDIAQFSYTKSLPFVFCDNSRPLSFPATAALLQSSGICWSGDSFWLISRGWKSTCASWRRGQQACLLLHGEISCWHGRRIKI